MTLSPRRRKALRRQASVPALTPPVPAMAEQPRESAPTGGFTVQIEHVQFARDDKRGEDGAVYYLILTPCTERPCRHECEAHPQMTHHYERQAFRRGAFGHRLDATPEDIANDRANVWGWDGNCEAPTLTPSYLALDTKDGKQLRPYRMHSFLTAGRIALCGDSTVTLHPSPTPCSD